MNFTFGPVPSRRFGMSLGINLSPTLKQCNFDCLYCELKPANTVDKQISTPKVSNIILEVRNTIEKYPSINVITLTADGEPTLYPYLDQLITQLNIIKGDIKTLILSNGGNIYDQNIQKTLTKLDIVKLSLDCISSKCFKKLDRTNKSVDCQKIADGMINFRKLYNKELIIEILFVKDLNDNDDEIKLLKYVLQKIKPNRIDIGTIDRPPAYDVRPITYNKLKQIANKLENLPVCITYKNRLKAIQSFTKTNIINLLKMRPLTKEDIENTFDDLSKKRLQTLLKDDIIYSTMISSVQFYKFNYG
ncbi:Putative Fe-S oxidoreductase [hydrothermal vent metagenome]|uniref:Fe-S oxidoreductase n=1 Tax=hydrothermal vent metagenome TaxID=652676 RepID=A0A3B1DS77_9ZZZZ